MKKKMMKRLLVMALSVAMVMPMAGCGNSQDAGNDTASDSREQAVGEDSSTGGELTKITMYPMDANTPSGVVGGYKGEIFAEQGIELEVWAYSDEKTNAILASGDLPDVMYVNYENLKTMIEGGMVLNLDEHLDALPHANNSEMISTALNYLREYKSAGTGVLYALPTQVGEQAEAWSMNRNQVVVNWEVYQSIGCPEVENIWDLIPLMKDMMEAKPETEDGTKTWGTILNAGSDTDYWGCMQMWNKWQGYEPNNLQYMVDTDMIHDEYHNILEEGRDSLYYEGMKFYNACYREGVMDPDSINNERSVQKAKVETSVGAMVPSGSLQGWMENYMPIYIPGQELYMENWSSPYGKDAYLVINAQTKNLEASLKLLDMFSDVDVFYKVWNGNDGDGVWYMGDDGKTYITDEALEAATNKTEFFLNTGEKIEVWNDHWVTQVCEPTSFLDTDGNPRKARGTSEWPEVLEILENTGTKNQWRELYGYDSFNALLKDKGGFTLTSKLQNAELFAADPDDNQKLIMDAMKDTVVQACWKMVYAESDAEFDALWDQMIADCIELGGDEIAQWRIEELEKAIDIKEALASK